MLLSHWHGDHVGGIKQLLAAYPTVKVHKNRPEDGQLNISDNDVFSVESATLRAVHSPGHTQDHMSFVLEEEDALFTADNILGHGTAVFEDLASYMNSLRRMESMFNGVAYPGHGAVVNDGKARVSQYIRHRQLREDQVLQVLRSPHPSASNNGSGRQLGAWASMGIVRAIYKDVREDLHIPAHGGVMQVLTKLQEENKVHQDQSTGDWMIRGKPTL